MRSFIDCEFNGASGALISMGIVTEDGQRQFYEVVDFAEPVEPWVKENVMPILEKPAIPYAVFQQKLRAFLGQFPVIHVIADHPEDISRLCKAMIISGGDYMLDKHQIIFEVDDSLSAKASKVPHNAFHDAVAVRNSWLKTKGYLND